MSRQVGLINSHQLLETSVTVGVDMQSSSTHHAGVVIVVPKLPNGTISAGVGVEVEVRSIAGTHLSSIEQFPLFGHI